MLADRVLPGTLPDNCRSLSFASRTKAGRGLRFEAALDEGASAEAGRDRRAHVPDLRGAGRAARAAARRPASPLVHALEAHADAGSRGEGVHRRRQRRPALVPHRLAEGGRHRPRHRPRRVPVPPGGPAGERLPRRVARPLLAREGPRDDRARDRASRRRAAGGVRSCALGRRARAQGGAGPPSRRARPREARQARRRRAALRGAGRLRPRRLPRQQHGGGRARQDRLRGGGELPARDRLEPRLRRAARRAARAAAVRPRRPGAAGCAHRAAGDDGAPAQRASIGRVLRERVAAGHSVQHWAEQVLEVAQR